MEYVFAAAVTGLAGAVVLGGVWLFRRGPMPAGVRIALSLLLVAAFLFCAFGFGATFEPPEPGMETRWIVWRVGYAAVGLSCLAGAARLLVPGRRADEPDEE